MFDYYQIGLSRTRFFGLKIRCQLGKNKIYDGSLHLRKIVPKYFHIIQCGPSWHWSTPHADSQQSLSCHIPDCCKIKNPGIATIVLIFIFFTIFSIPVPTVSCGVFAKLLSQIFIVFTTISKLIQSYF